MNPKTEVTGTGLSPEKQSEFSPMFLWWLISLTIMTLLLVFFGNYVVEGRQVRLVPVPWTMAGSVIIRQGLDIFGGHAVKPISLEDNVSMLAGLLVTFVIGPVLLLFCWRRLLTGPKQSWLSAPVIGFVFGIVFMSMGILGTVTAAIMAPRVAASMHKAQDLAENRDQVIAGMWRVSTDAYQYKILPKSHSGGGGSYKGYQVPPALQKLETNEFIVVSSTDTSVTIMGSSTKFPDAAVKGVYNRQGKLSGTFNFIGSYQ